MNCMRKAGDPGKAYVLTNMANAIGNTGQPDEIDVIVVSPDGVVVIEVKHWDREKLAKYVWEVEDAADLITKKTKRSASRVREINRGAPFVSCAMVFTKENGTFAQSKVLKTVRGVRIASLADVETLLAPGAGLKLGNQEVERLARGLAPRAVAAHSGDIKRIGRITELKRLSPKEDRFARVYSGRDASSADRVTVHFFDLSATTSPNAERLARREFEVVQKLPKVAVSPQVG